MSNDYYKKLKQKFIEMKKDDDLLKEFYIEFLQVVQLLDYVNTNSTYGISYAKFSSCFYDEILKNEQTDLHKGMALENIQNCLEACIGMNFISNTDNVLHITEEGLTYLENDNIITNHIH